MYIFPNFLEIAFSYQSKIFLPPQSPTLFLFLTFISSLWVGETMIVFLDISRLFSSAVLRLSCSHPFIALRSLFIHGKYLLCTCHLPGTDKKQQQQQNKTLSSLNFLLWKNCNKESQAIVASNGDIQFAKFHDRRNSQWWRSTCT